MNKFLPALLLGALLAVGGVRAEGEIAFIDMQEVFKRFYKTQLAQDQIRQQADDIKREREEIEAEVKVMNEEIETLRTDSRDDTLSADVRANKRDQLEEKLIALQKKERDMIDFEKLRREQMNQQNSRMTRKIFDEIHASVITYSKSKNYGAVIDRSAKSRVGTDTILYVNPKIDITADVLAELNEGREGTLKVGPEFEKENAKKSGE